MNRDRWAQVATPGEQPPPWYWASGGAWTNRRLELIVQYPWMKSLVHCQLRPERLLQGPSSPPTQPRIRAATIDNSLFRPLRPPAVRLSLGTPKRPRSVSLKNSQSCCRGVSFWMVAGSRARYLPTYYSECYQRPVQPLSYS
jgi:hypothetical protein